MGIALLTGVFEEDVPKKPKPRTMIQEAKQSMKAMRWLAPRELELLQQYAPGYAETFAGMGEILTSRQREGDIAAVEDLGPRAVAAFKAANPELATLLDELNAEAMGEMTPMRRRRVEQAVRAGQAARGFGVGPSDLWEELIALEGETAATRREAMSANQAIANVPFMSVLGRPVMSMGLAQQGMPTYDAQNPYAADVFNTNFNASWTDRISAQNRNAAIKGALIGAIGQIMGGAAGGAAGACHVARVVFGELDPRWVLFRAWLNIAHPPSNFQRSTKRLFRWAYVKWGAMVAAWLRPRPWARVIVRRWMESKIAEVRHGG